MRSDIFIAESLTQMSRHSLSHPPRVDEDKRRLVFANQVADAIVNLFPNFIRHQSFEWRTRNFEREIELAPMTPVDDRAVRRSIVFDIRRADEEPRDFFDRFLSC